MKELLFIIVGGVIGYTIGRVSANWHLALQIIAGASCYISAVVLANIASIAVPSDKESSNEPGNFLFVMAMIFHLIAYTGCLLIGMGRLP